MKAKTLQFLPLLRSGSATLLAVGLACALAQPATAALTHRYSFTNDVTDSVGGANGTLMGGATISGGAAVFPGDTHDSYIELPPGLISNYTTVTFEFWADVGVNGIWEEIYAFGSQTAGGEGANMVMFCPHTGSNPADFRMSYTCTAPGYSNDGERVVNGVGVLDGLGLTHVACIYDPPNSAMLLYTNGALVGSLSPVTPPSGTTRGFSLTNVYNRLSWLGRSLYNGDAPYAGTIDEFRIYDKPLSPLQVYVDAQAGPDEVVTNIVINSLTWHASTNMVVGSRQNTTVTFNTAKYGSITLANATEPTYASSDPTVVKVNAQGLLFALKVGTATVSATYNGTVNQALVVVSPPQLIHRYSFTTDAKDSVGTANGTLAGSASISGGQLVLTNNAGLSSSDPAGSYLDLPNNLFTNITAVTLEAWVTDTGSGNWARVWDLGNSVGGEGVSDTGSRFIFLSLPANGNIQGTIHLNDRGGDAGVSTRRTPVGQPAHIVWSSDIANRTSWLYVNGALVAVNPNTTVAPADLGPTVNDWLGRSQYGGDALFTGLIDEFRIYSGAVSPFQVALDSASGPDKIVTDAGALQAVRAIVDTNALFTGGSPGQLTVLADYANISNVNVTTLSGVAFNSSDATVVAVNSSGQLLGAGPGTATLSASFGGMNAVSPAVTVTNLPGYTKATLIHRYSFSEPAGSTTAKDSVGTADGVLAGNGGAFTGTGQVHLNGGTSSSADASTISGYVDLPNHIINVLTNASFEAWITWEAASQWQRIFDLGTSSGGEDISNGGGNYLFLTPQGSANHYQFSVRDPATGTEPAPLVAAAALPVGQPIYVAVVYDFNDNVASLYENGVRVAAGAAPVDLTTIDDVNNWLGRSQWGDPMFHGWIDEFRIWDGTLLPSEIATHYAAGPDSLTVVQGPKLTVARAGQNVVVSWPASATGFTLQSTPTLGTGATWTAVTITPVTSNGVTSVTVPIGQTPQFMRLKK